MTNDSTVACDTCGLEKEMRFAHGLRDGWPQHCGTTMRLTRSPDEHGCGMAMEDIVRPGLTAMLRAAMIEEGLIDA